MNLKPFLILLLLLTTSSLVLAQDEDMQARVEYKVNNMKNVLKLNDSQTIAVEPIIKEYLVKRSSVLQEVAGEGIVDHISVKKTLKALKENEYQQLSKVLTEDQLKKWIEKENLMATLNPDSSESSVDDGPSLGMDGASFKF